MQPRPKKALGQHWLNDDLSLETIVRAADVTPGDNVLEVGPGTGFLTDKLLASGAQVTALEFDEHWAKELQRKYADNQSITVVEGDIRIFDTGSLPRDYKMVANIPYYLTANLLRRLVDDDNKPFQAALLVQKEVAQRIASELGDYSLIAVLVQLFYTTSLDAIVPAHLFDPPPKIDSQILVLHRRPRPLYKPTDAFFKVVKAGFSQKRKKIKTSLASGLGVSKTVASDLLAQAHIDEHKRPQELSHGEWHRLSTVYE